MVDELDAVLKRQISLLTPKEGSKKPDDFIKELNELLTRFKIDAEAVIGGSWAKGTYLPNDHDIDVFVRFNPKYSDSEMSNLLGKVLLNLGDPLRVKGSRDYFQIGLDGFNFELVPVMRIDDPKDARNVTDMSPMHVEYVRKHIERNPSLTDNIRLAKRFCKAAGIYGAESYINGFSGHVIDLLVINHGSFIELLKAASGSWGDRLVLPVGADTSFLSKDKTLGPMIIVDPIQPNRNAAAALSKESFNRFKEVAKNFLDNPSDDYFKIIPVTKEYLGKKFPKDLFVYELLPLRGSKDVVGTKLLKVHEHFVKQAIAEGFEIIDEGFHFDGKLAICYLVVKESELTPIFERIGPPTSQEKDVEKFLLVHRAHEVSEKEGRLIVRLPRKHTNLKSLFSELKKEDYFNSRSKAAKII